MTLVLVGLVLALAGPGPAAAGPVPRSPVVLTRTRPDQIRADQWQLDRLGVRQVWPVSTGQGVTVAVLDSGVDGSHPDLKGQVMHGTDLVDEGGDGWADKVGHGTTVAGLIAGRSDDDRGVEGLAPGVRILPVRVLDAENRYDDAVVVARGVRWAVDNGAQVINMSLGGAGESPALAAALDYAFVHDVVVVACTGNLATSPDSGVWYPAREPGVIAVTGARGGTDALWSGSISGPETVLTAPATDLVGARPGGFWQVQGTSFAAPMVSATAALVRARWPRMSAGDVVNRLLRTARDLGPTGRDDRFGYGMVDPVAAVNATEVGEVVRNPLDDDSSPGVAGFGPAPAPVPTGGHPSTAAAGWTGLPGPGGGTRWMALPAGAAGQRHRADDLWAGAAAFVVVLTGNALMVRRRFLTRGR